VNSLGSRAPLTFCQSTIVTLYIIGKFNHLNPASRPSHTEHISDVLCPSVSVNCTGHHSRLHDIKLMRLKGKSGLASSAILTRCSGRLSRSVDIVYLQVQVGRHLLWLHGRTYIDANDL